MGKKSNNPINNRIANLMRANGVTQEAVAQAISRSQSAVNERLASDKTFPIDQLQKIAPLLGVRVTDLTVSAREVNAAMLPKERQELLSNDDLLAVLNRRFEVLERELHEIKEMISRVVLP